MAVKATRRLFPRAIERSYRARIRRRLQTIQNLLLEMLEEDPANAVGRIRQVVNVIPIPKSELLRTARQGGAFSSNCAVRETVKISSGTKAQKTAAIGVLKTRADALTETIEIGGVTLSAGPEGLPLPAGKLDRWADDNARLIDGLTQSTLDQVAVIIEDAVREGRSTREVAGEIRDRFGVAERRAKTIARDQIGSLNADITRDRQTDLGITHYTWQTAEDERVRPEHRALDGKIRRWDDPHPIEGHPGQAINCRCVALPVFSDEPKHEWPVERIEAIESLEVSSDAQDAATGAYFEAPGRGTTKIENARRTLLRQGLSPQDADRALSKVLDPRAMSPEALERNLAPLKTLEEQAPTPFTISKTAERDGAVLVNVNVEALDKAWREADPERYVAPGGYTPSGERAGKYDRFQEWMADNPNTPVQSSYVGFVDGAGFVDGRHRFAVLRDRGAETITIAVDPSDLAQVRALQGGTKRQLTPQGAAREAYATEAGARLAQVAQASGDDRVKEALDIAYHNITGGEPLPAPAAGDVPKATMEASKNARRELLAQLTFAMEDATDDEVKSAVADAARALGAKDVGAVGDIVEFDARFHNDIGGESWPGDRVRVVTPGLEALNRAVSKAIVEPVEDQ